MKKNRFERLEDRKDKLGFEKDPPLCKNCVHRRIHEHHARGNTKMFHICLLGDFRVSIHSVCNAWRGNKGETLES